MSSYPNGFTTKNIDWLLSILVVLSLPIRNVSTFYSEAEDGKVLSDLFSLHSINDRLERSSARSLPWNQCFGQLGNRNGADVEDVLAFVIGPHARRSVSIFR